LGPVCDSVCHDPMKSDPMIANNVTNTSSAKNLVVPSNNLS